MGSVSLCVVILSTFTFVLQASKESTDELLLIEILKMFDVIYGCAFNFVEELCSIGEDGFSFSCATPKTLISFYILMCCERGRDSTGKPGSESNFYYQHLPPEIRTFEKKPQIIIQSPLAS